MLINSFQLEKDTSGVMHAVASNELHKIRDILAVLSPMEKHWC